MRAILRRAAAWVAGLWLVLSIIASMAVILAPHVNAAPPKARSQQECVLVGDMVIVAHALEKRGVSHELADGVMRDVYSNLLEGEAGKHWQALMEGALGFARRRDVQGGALSFEAGMAVANQCHASRGDLSAIFGVGT